MITITSTIQKFGKKGEKTGWSYIEIPAVLAETLNPGVRKSFKIKGKLDQLDVKGLALIPMGNGDFILPLKADLRKKLHKEKDAVLSLSSRLTKSLKNQ